MIEQHEKDLIACGAIEAIAMLGNNLHSEDDHGYDLYKWLKSRQKEIIEMASNKILLTRVMLVD